MTREEVIAKLEEAQEGMPGPYGQAIRFAIKDMRRIQKFADFLNDTETECEGGACPIKYMEDDRK